MRRGHVHDGIAAGQEGGKSGSLPCKSRPVDGGNIQIAAKCQSGIGVKAALQAKVNAPRQLLMVGIGQSQTITGFQTLDIRIIRHNTPNCPY